MKALLAYDWPGNVRELENCLERAVALGDQRCIEINDLPPSIARAEKPEKSARFDLSASGDPSRHRPRRYRTRHHRARVRPGQRRQSLAGKMLGISRATLYRKLKRYNIALRSEGASPTLQ